jgi:DNA transposition AAA+ family ATPase
MEMDKQKKDEIALALRQYMEANNLSQEDAATRAGINVSYINAIHQGRHSVGKTMIKDRYYASIGEMTGTPLGNTYWEHVDTEQYECIIEELLDAKVRGFNKMIIGETGSGKTYSVDRFVRKYPAFTYRITVSSDHTLKNILNELGECMGIRYGGDNVYKIRQIAAKMRLYKTSGKKPVIIIDEGENLKLPQLRAVKSLYDALQGYCPVVLIGTDQLLNKIERLTRKNEDGMPQLYRRFKAGKREIRAINKETMFAPFLAGIEDENLCQMLIHLADNYGELNDYVEPALREAAQHGQPLTENFFRMLYKI